MLKDRRVLLEQEMIKLKQACGKLYQKVVFGHDSNWNDSAGLVEWNESKMYESMKLKLTDMIAEIAIVDQMIADGHE